MDLFDLQASIGIDASDYMDALDDAMSAAQDFSDTLENAFSGSIAGLDSFAEEEKAAGAALKDTGEIAGGFSEKLALIGTSAVAVGSAIASGIGIAIDVIKDLSSTISAAVNQTASYLDTVDKQSQIIGISAQAYQEWDFILQHCGASIGTMRMSLKTLSAQAEGNSEAFDRLGVSITNADGTMKSQEQLFSDVITGLQGMEAGTERTALATKLLGRGAQEFAALLNTSAEDTEAMRKELMELGGVMDDDAVAAGARFEDMLLNMQTAMTGFKNQLIADFLPGFSAVMEGISNIFKGGSESVDLGQSQIRVGVQGLVSTLAAGIPDFIKTGGQIVLGIADGIISTIPDALASIPQVLDSLYNSVIENTELFESAGYDLIDALAAGIPAAIPVVLACINSLGAAIFNLVLSFAKGMVAKGAELLNSLASGISGAISGVLGAINSVGAVIIGGIAAFVSGMVTKGRELIGGLANGISGAISAVLGAIQSIISGIKNKLSSVDLKTIGANMINGLINGIKSKVESAIKTVGNLADSLSAKIRSATQQASPSKLWRKYGQYLVDGLQLGIEDRKSTILQTVEDLANSINGAYARSIAELEEQINAINDAQAQRDAEREAEARASRLADLEAKVAAAIGDARIAAEAELQKQLDEWAEEELRAQEEADKKQLSEQILYLESLQDAYADALSGIEEEYADTMNNIGKEQERMSDKLKDYSDLFTWEQKRNGPVLKLDNLDTDINALQQYSDMLNSLKDRGINSELMDEILGMSIENATAYGSKLLAMGEGTFISYMEQYATKNALAESIAAQWYAPDIAEANLEYIKQRQELNQQYLSSDDTAGLIGNIAAKVANAIGDKITESLNISATIEVDGASLAKTLIKPIRKEALRMGGATL